MNKILKPYTNTDPAQPKTRKALPGWLARILDCVLVFNVNIKPKTKEEKIGLFVLIIVIGFAVAVAYHYIMGYYLDKPWPENTFLHKPGVHFWDFILVVRQSAGLSPFINDIGGFAGSPFAHFVGYLFSIIQISWLQLLVFFSSFFIVTLLLVKHYLYGFKSKIGSYQLLAIFVIVFLQYPVIFAVDRANFDLLVCAALLLFVLAYGRQKFRVSTVFLALAIALKPYAGIFLMVYIFDKRYKDTLLVLFNVLFFTILSLALFKGGFFTETKQYFTALFSAVDYLSAGNQQAFTSDLYGLLTVVTQFIGNKLGADIYLPAYHEVKIIYGLFAIAVFVYLTVYVWKNHQPPWKILALLTILLVLLPFGTADYRLIYLLVPMLMFIAAGEKTRHDMIIIILWGLLLIPKNYYTLQSPQNIGMIINPLLLVGLLISIIPNAFSLKGFYSVFRSVGPETKTKELVI